ncbi:hypothetical protein ABG768_026291, partial [Culter alburnus]
KLCYRTMGAAGAMILRSISHKCLHGCKPHSLCRQGVTDSGVSEVPIPADDTTEVLNKTLSGLSLRLKNWWERYLWEILTPAMIPSFFFIFIVYLGPMVLMMMMPFLIKCFHQIITTGYREKITDYFFTLVQREGSVHMLSKYHHFIPFALNLVGF